MYLFWSNFKKSRHLGVRAQSRQSAKFFLKSSEWGLPHPQASVPSPFWFRGEGAHSRAREGVGESQFRRGDIHCGTLQIYGTYFVVWCLYRYLVHAPPPPHLNTRSGCLREGVCGLLPLCYRAGAAQDALVILGPLPRVAQHLVGLGHALELSARAQKHTEGNKR